MARRRDRARAGHRVDATREPGGTPLGEPLRDLLLHTPMTHDTEALLMFAARREHVEQVIRPALARGDWVLCDRFTDATYAYQGGGHGVDAARDRGARALVHADCRPDLHAPVRRAARRVARAPRSARGSGSHARQVRARDLAFFERVRAAYLERARAEPARFRVVDSSRPLDDVRAELARDRGDVVSDDDDDAAAAAPAWPPLLPWQRPRASGCASATWPHALLITGPRGIGKRTLALNLARGAAVRDAARGRPRLRRVRGLRVRRSADSIPTCAWSSRSRSTTTAR